MRLLTMGAHLASSPGHTSRASTSHENEVGGRVKRQRWAGGGGGRGNAQQRHHKFLQLLRSTWLAPASLPSGSKLTKVQTKSSPKNKINVSREGLALFSL